MEQEKKPKPSKDDAEEKKKKKKEDEESEEDEELERNLGTDDIGAALSEGDFSKEGVGQIPEEFRQKSGE